MNDSIHVQMSCSLQCALSAICLVVSADNCIPSPAPSLPTLPCNEQNNINMVYYPLSEFLCFIRNIDVCETLMPPFPNMTFDLDLWPTDLKINRDHLLIKDYLPTKFEASWAKPSWVISCTRLRATDIPTYRPTDRCNAICPSFFKGGHKYFSHVEALILQVNTSLR